MRAVGVRQLKMHLSEYLRRVQAGERLTVTDRGREIAAIVPIAPAPRLEWAHGMVAEGRARWHGGKPLGLATRIRARGRSASAMVIEDRR